MLVSAMVFIVTLNKKRSFVLVYSAKNPLSVPRYHFGSFDQQYSPGWILQRYMYLTLKAELCSKAS